MKVYHYEHIEDWEDVVQEGFLSPHSVMGTKYPPAWQQFAVFALFKPDAWQDNQDFPQAHKALERHVGDMLLEIEVDENDPDVKVVDWGHRGAFVRPQNGEVPVSAYEHEQAYLETAIPLKDYLARKEVLHYSLPEIIITKSIALEKVKISNEQPLLEYRLAEYKGEFKRNLINRVRQIPELEKWYEGKYERREPDSEFNLKNFK